MIDMNYLFQCIIYRYFVSSFTFRYAICEKGQYMFEVLFHRSGIFSNINA